MLGSVLGNCQGIVSEVSGVAWEVSVRCLGCAWALFGKWLGSVFGHCLGIVWGVAGLIFEVYGNCLGSAWDCLGSVLELSEECLGSVWEVFGEFVWDFLGIVWAVYVIACQVSGKYL